jgi:hypothetical protein
MIPFYRIIYKLGYVTDSGEFVNLKVDGFVKSHQQSLLKKITKRKKGVKSRPLWGFYTLRVLGVLGGEKYTFYEFRVRAKINLQFPVLRRSVGKARKLKAYQAYVAFSQRS